jgi:RimJ/RimL family protein N-acetyltransferase
MDAELAADLMTAAFPREPEDPVLTRYRWEHPRGEWTARRFIASVGDRPVAFLANAYQDWEKNEERNIWVEVYLDLAQMDHERLRDMWLWAERDSVEQGGLVLNAAAAEEETVAQAVLAELGYELDRDDKVWNLDLRKHGERLTAEAAAARAKAKHAGIDYVTMAAFDRPDKFEAVHALDQRTRMDIPRSVPAAPEPFDSWLARSAPPDRPPDRWWLAVDGNEPVAMSYLGFPPVRGNVWTRYTCCHADYRGRGLARGVKLQTLAQAVELGVPNVHADNDSENAAMLHINATLGYEAMPGFTTFQKRVKR